jgi:SWI/SNF chromatin-remodeling complex subunit SWI1
LESGNFVNLVETILAYKPNMPALMEMGVVDIRALTMSIRSGLRAETRLALDALSKLTYEQNLTLELEKCEDLVDVLAEYAEDQLEILANDNPEVSDIIDLTPYEDVIHNCNVEVSSLQDIAEFGTKAYDLERTADRLISITTIFRNLSFLEINHAALASPSVLRFFSSAVRLVGTRVLFLRSHVNTFDFMKDLVTFFSNTSTKIILPSREDAYTILHFLCAFAPVPRPGTPVRFTPYNSQIHKYLPSAVDSLAKLLARDDPNRTYYKEIFANEATSTPPYDLLTRAFSLAIAVVPDRTSGRLYQVAETRASEVRYVEARIAEARKPYLMQGMLAADILASLAPGPESGVCRSWLESEDGWASSLIKFAMSLSATDASVQPPQQMQRGQQRPMDHDIQGFQLIVQRALSTLKRLGDKSRGGEVLVKGPQGQTNGHAKHGDDEDDDDDFDTVDLGGSVWRIKADVFPKKETLLGALLTERLDGRSLRQFCGIGYLDDI